MSEIGGDFMRMILILVILIGGLFMFRLWASFGMWPFIIIIILILLVFALYKAGRAGYINI